jgi:hypothetical protein
MRANTNVANTIEQLGEKKRFMRNEILSIVLGLVSARDLKPKS